MLIISYQPKVITGNFFSLNLVLVVLNSAFENEGKDTDEQQAARTRIADEKHVDATSDAIATVATDTGENVEISGSFEHFNPNCGSRRKPFCRSLEIMITGSDGRILSLDNFVTLLILANTIVLSMDRYPMSMELSRQIEFYNFLLTMAFTLEMLLKLAVFGPRRYAQDYFNVFDAAIVCISLVELYFSPPYFLKQGSSGTGAVSALRSFRLFRIFKLAKKWKSMQILLGKCLETTFSMGPFLVLLVLFMYIYTLLGMSFFANRMNFDDIGYPVTPGKDGFEYTTVPRENFDTFLWGFTTVFAILTGENWNVVLFDARRGTSGAASIYFITLIVFGMFIVMNLFLAILLSNFSDLTDENGSNGFDKTSPLSFETLKKAEYEADQSKPQEEGEAEEISHELMENGVLEKTSKKAETTGKKSKQQTNESWVYFKRGDLDYKLYDTHVLYCFDIEHPFRIFCAEMISRPSFDHAVLFTIVVSCIVLVYDSPLANPESVSSKILAGINITLTVLFAIESSMKIVANGLISVPGSYLRDGWNCLDFGVVIVSLISLIFNSDTISAFKALRAFRALRPLRMIHRVKGLKIVVNTFLGALPDVLNVVLVCIVFFLIFSIVAVNYLKGKFYHCSGSVFDNVISGTAYETFLQDPKDWETVKADETMRGWFGPSSDFSFSPSWTSTCSAEWPSRPCCDAWPANTGGSNKWKDSSVPTSKELCDCWGAEWRPAIPQRFDNVFMAFISFFEIASTEGWVDLMLAAVDSTEIDMQPKKNNQLLWVPFFIFFMLFGCYLTINLFVGVIIERFAKLREEQKHAGKSSNILYTPEQAAWKKTQELMLKTLNKEYIRERIKPRHDSISQTLFPIVMAPAFERTIMFFVIINAVVMAVVAFGQDDRQTEAINDLNVLFVVIFNLEFLAKFGALRINYFMHFIEGAGDEGKASIDYWNCFDFCIVVGTDIGYLLMSMGGTPTTLSGIAMVVRTFRVMRIVRLMNGVRSLKTLCQTLLTTLPGLFNVFAVLMLLIFIYAIMGVQLFSTISYRGDVNEHANFRTFWGAVLVLLRSVSIFC